MKKLSISLTVIFGIVLLSCGEKKSEANEIHDHEIHENHAIEEESTEIDSDDNNEIAEAIALDNGAKWKVNNEMKPFVTESESLVKKYVDSKSTDYKELAKQLKDENSKLIKSCTMKGKSHEELHKWLHPHMELLDELADEESPENANKLVTELQKSFETYHQYFD